MRRCWFFVFPLFLGCCPMALRYAMAGPVGRCDGTLSLLADIEKSPAEATDAAVAGGIQSRARRRNCRHSNSAPTGPEAPAKAGSSGPTKMQELAGNGSPPSTAASPASTSQNWPPPVLGAPPVIAVQGGIR